MKYLSPRAAFIFATLTMWAHTGFSADIPNPVETAARELQRQQERERAQRERLEKTPDVHLPRGQIPGRASSNEAADLPCFPIRALVLEGGDAERFAFALEAAPELERWADEPRCLGAKGIDTILEAVQNAIISRGYVTTRVLARPQDLTSGTLRLVVVPGRVHGIRIDDGGSRRATLRNALPTSAGRLLDLRDIEQGLENLKRVPSVEADIQIAPAGPPGQSDLLVSWKQASPLRAGVSLDDAGSKATGRYQGSATLSYDHWLTLNDLFYFTLNHGLGGGGQDPKGTRGYVVHYSVPWGYWLLSATASENAYRQSVAGLSQAYLYSGNSSNGELRLTRLLYRNALRKTSVSLAGWTRSSKNFIDDTEVEVQRRRMAGWELGANHREFIGPATADLTLAYRRGTGADHALDAPEQAFGEGTSRPRIFKADAQLNLPFAANTQRMRYGLAWRGQWNRTPLVPQDRFSIGNRYTVRGFDGESTLSAERGWLVRNELGWTVADIGAELYLGVDYGELGGPSAAFLLGRHLAGSVAGLRGSARGLSYEVFVGRPLSKPEGFRTASTTAGFSLSWSY